MLTLAVETSGLTASAAVVENGRVISELNLQHGKTHSQKIVPMLKTMLGIIDKDFKDIDLFAASTGPGSFTGLRIGVVTIKGLAYSLNKPVCGISTLDSMAFLVPDYEGVISPMLDARNNQVYTALYRKTNGRIEKLQPEQGILIDEWIGKLKSFDKIMILGDGAPLHHEKMKNALGDGVTMAPAALFFPRAASTAILAEQAYYENKAMSPFDLKPMYVRKSQAERMKELKP